MHNYVGWPQAVDDLSSPDACDGCSFRQGNLYALPFSYFKASPVHVKLILDGVFHGGTMPVEGDLVFYISHDDVSKDAETNSLGRIKHWCCGEQAKREKQSPNIGQKTTCRSYG